MVASYHISFTCKLPSDERVVRGYIISRCHFMATVAARTTYNSHMCYQVNYPLNSV